MTWTSPPNSRICASSPGPADRREQELVGDLAPRAGARRHAASTRGSSRLSRRRCRRDRRARPGSASPSDRSPRPFAAARSRRPRAGPPPAGDRHPGAPRARRTRSTRRPAPGAWHLSSGTRASLAPGCARRAGARLAVFPCNTSGGTSERPRQVSASGHLRQVEAGCGSSGAGERSGLRRRGARGGSSGSRSSIVPTSARTMCRKNESAVISNSEHGFPQLDPLHRVAPSARTRGAPSLRA